MKRVKITKYAFNQNSEYLVVNNEFNLIEDHPNNINVGTVREGLISQEPTVGECFYLQTSKTFSGFFRTSPVVEVLSNGFKTLNSFYKLEVLDENVDENAPETLDSALANLFGDSKKDE